MGGDSEMWVMLARWETVYGGWLYDKWCAYYFFSDCHGARRPGCSWENEEGWSELTDALESRDDIYGDLFFSFAGP